MLDMFRLAIIIPAAAALITGALVGALTLALAAWQGWPMLYGLLAAAVTALLSWLAWSARYAEIIEHRIAPDLHKAQPQPDKTPKEINLRIHEVKGEYLEGAYLHRLPVSEQALAALANQVISGQSLTTSQITGSGLLSRPDWEGLRDRFISAGLLTWRGGNRQYGVEITQRGRAVFQRLAQPGEAPPTHPPARVG